MVRSKKFFSFVEWVVLVAIFLAIVLVWLFKYSPWTSEVQNFFNRFQTTLAKEGLAPLPQYTNSKGIPPYTNQVAQALAASHGFQLLISYTDTGFQPASATIKKGQTIRFTNNSSGQLQIVADGKTPLPAASSEVSGQFWEFTFTDSGTWQYENTLNPKYSGMIRVQ